MPGRSPRVHNLHAPNSQDSPLPESSAPLTDTIAAPLTRYSRQDHGFPPTFICTFPPPSLNIDSLANAHRPARRMRLGQHLFCSQSPNLLTHRRQSTPTFSLSSSRSRPLRFLFFNFPVDQTRHPSALLMPPMLPLLGCSILTLRVFLGASCLVVVLVPPFRDILPTDEAPEFPFFVKPIRRMTTATPPSSCIFTDKQIPLFPPSFLFLIRSTLAGFQIYSFRSWTGS